MNFLMSKSLYEPDKFPEYCSGPMYMMTISALEKITKLFEQEYKNQFIWIEDVLLTGKIVNEGPKSPINH